VKVAIIGGAGGIGSSVAFNLLRTQTPYEILIIDKHDHMITSHVMDLQDALSLGGAVSIRGAEAHEAADADIIVCSAAVPLTLNTSRDVFLNSNATIVASVVDPLVEAGWDGVFILMTNPVDPLLTFIEQRTGWSREKLLGYTLNDSQRFRTGIAQALDIAPQRVSCWVVGEHGPGQVPLFDRILVNDQPVQLSDEQRAVTRDYIDNWYVRHVALDSGRTSTWSSGLGGALMVEALSRNSQHLFPASVVLSGEYGVSEVSLSVPVRLSPTGITRIEQFDLSDEELAGMSAAAEKIKQLTAAIDI